ncbi:hypothetical protein ACPPVO_52115 [Dactylosporangium sp. McL0621]|uniref:hypothetical protein n=1 Tax=Dactylosporangium sp. McL0621 TaxID=3415678 RepID=UPI003CEDE555
MGAEPDSVSVRLYLDDVAPEEVLRRWHAAVADVLLTASLPEGWGRPRPQVRKHQSIWYFEQAEPLVEYNVGTSLASGPLTMRAWSTFPPEREDAVLAAAVELVRVVAGVVDVGYGQVEFSGPPGPKTGLVAGLNRDPELAREPARTALRGYDWVTVVPPELVARLGGAGVLRDSGAFHRVEGLAHGGVLAQATESPRAFDRNAARAVAGVLRPVFAAVRTAGSWGVEVTGDVAGMVRQWRLEGYSYSGLARVAGRVLGVDAGADVQFGMALCRESAAVLGEDADDRPWN